MADPQNTGIYEIVNVVNGKRYVGSAAKLRKRWLDHQRPSVVPVRIEKPLQRAWIKYGRNAFEFRVLLVCRKADLLLYEQLALDGLQPEYNICKIAGSTLGVKFTDESKAKISIALTGKLLGRKRTPESVAGTARAHRGMKRSDSTRAKIAAKAVGRKRSRESIEKGAAKRIGVKTKPEHIGHLIGNKHAVGHKHTEEWKAQNSIRHTGSKRPKSLEHRAKLSASLKGIPHSPERRSNQAAAQTGLKRKPYVTKSRSAGSPNTGQLSLL